MSIAMGGHIECYLDIASFFSYIALADLLPNLTALEGYGIQVDLIPTLIGGINHLSGNKPPWMLPAKAKYLEADSQRAARRVSKPRIAFPKDFLSMSNTISPLRAMLFIKKNYPEATFIAAMHFLFDKFWSPPHANLTVDEELAAVLAAATETPEGGPRLFGEEDVRRIMDGRAEMKDTLKQNTARAVELGAFGAPWFWVVNEEGKGEPFFGSDRFNHIYQHLGLPFQDVALVKTAKL
ncbi:thioredoxin-like protein [Stachybotrys elegans]|uniref:Glutathione S-transferase kappa 1 n=1 Tax=Stachybotrys elegans TaxID=80388 RepID=A0A8K0T118_9HYPO|nr:thioredoxin-like protein [Stachybotrys elegans]